MVESQSVSKIKKYEEYKKAKLMEPESRTVVVRAGGWGNGKMLVKGYNLSVTRCISSGDIMHSRVTIVNNTVCVLELC